MKTQQSDGQRAMSTGVPKLAGLIVSDSWERSELSKRDRSLVTVAALFASYRLAELQPHLDHAFENGVTKKELVETIAHLAFYTGWHTAASAFKLLSRSHVINDHRTQTRKSSTNIRSCHAMPYARISLMKGKPQEYLQALSDTLHRALVEAFDVPERDRFQIFQQLSPDEFVFDRDYLCGPRSDSFVLIAITAGRPRDTQTKKAFFQRLAELLEITPGIRPQDVMVVINTTEPDEWSFGNGIATMVAED